MKKIIMLLVIVALGTNYSCDSTEDTNFSDTSKNTNENVNSREGDTLEHNGNNNGGTIKP